MAIPRGHFKSSYGAFATRERELARTRARRDALDAAEQAVPPTAPQPSESIGGTPSDTPLADDAHPRA